MAIAAMQHSSSTSPAQGGSDTTIVPEGIAPTPIEVTDEPTTNQQAAQTALPTLLFIRSASSGQQLVQRVGAGSESVLFTDADLTVNLQSVLGVSDKKAVAVFASDDGQLELRSIALDGSGRTTVLNASFGGASGAALAPSKQVAFTIFDNAERSFGFSLVQEQFDGSGRSVIDTDAQGLSLPAWSRDGKQIAYVQGQATPDTGQVLRLATIGSKSDTMHTFEANATVTGLAWLDDHSVAYVTEPLGNNQQNNAKLYVFDLQSKQSRELIDLPGKERSVVVAAKATWLAVITGEVQAGEQQPAGTLTVFELASGKQQNLGTASLVGAWIQE
ncbi:MAG: hypothetical protein AAB701_02300 [Patescibacteria group bacterium]